MGLGELAFYGSACGGLAPATENTGFFLCVLPEHAVRSVCSTRVGKWAAFISGALCWRLPVLLQVKKLPLKQLSQWSCTWLQHTFVGHHSLCVVHITFFSFCSTGGNTLAQRSVKRTGLILCDRGCAVSVGFSRALLATLHGLPLGVCADSVEMASLQGSPVHSSRRFVSKGDTVAGPGITFGNVQFLLRLHNSCALGHLIERH